MQLKKLFMCGVAGLVGLLEVAGCGCGDINCSPCISSGIVVEVRDSAVDIPVEDATVITGGRMCPVNGNLGPGWYQCDVEPGTYSIEVIAPGHVSQTTTVTLGEEVDTESCCSCGPQATAKVQLAPM